MSSEDSSLIEPSISLDQPPTVVNESQSRRPLSPVDALPAQALLVFFAVLAAFAAFVGESPRPTSANDLAAPIRIDLNRATHEELNLLPGIGDKMAIKLIDRRDQIHGFPDWQSIESVPGMGPATVRQMQQWCSLGPARSTEDVVFLASRNH